MWGELKRGWGVGGYEEEEEEEEQGASFGATLREGRRETMWHQPSTQQCKGINHEQQQNQPVLLGALCAQQWLEACRGRVCKNEGGCQLSRGSTGQREDTRELLPQQLT